jgi:hypothetical protein
MFHIKLTFDFSRRGVPTHLLGLGHPEDNSSDNSDDLQKVQFENLTFYGGKIIFNISLISGACGRWAETEGHRQ